jgi:DNA-binding response OmpR family regulator
MREAWIYPGDAVLAGSLEGDLAELGYTARRLGAEGDLGMGGLATPALMVVAVGAGRGERAAEACAELRGADERAAVPLLVAIGGATPAEGGALHHGDELLVAPWSAGELRLRIARAGRRLGLADEDEIIRVGSLELNVATYQVTIDGRPVDFTYMEYELLRFLASHPNRVFSREVLLNRVWQYDFYGGTRTVDVHVRRVRAKLGAEHAARIRTVRSVGYRFER